MYIDIHMYVCVCIYIRDPFLNSLLITSGEVVTMYVHLSLESSTKVVGTP